MSKTFRTEVILAAATDVLSCKMEDVYKIMSYMTDDELFTHQLPRASRICAPHLKTQFPWIEDVNMDGCNERTYRPWLIAVIHNYGAEHKVEPLPAGAWEHQNPLEELIKAVGGKRVIAVDLGDEQRGGNGHE